ncbi:DUF2071 domain-containing protein, partial [Mycobacterium malmoense]|uniref:DUF2071 domain-containing protein n=1 Tax=Mycobacterium malmoense TaxID=1780 RepID=UPI000AB5C0FA
MTATPEPPFAGPGGCEGLAGYPVTPPRLRGPVTFDQRWRDLTFLHWPVRPDTVETMYPPGTAPDMIGPYEVLRNLPDAEVRFVWH